MKTLTYFYNSDFPIRGHKDMIHIIHTYALTHNYLYDIVDVRYMTSKIWREYMGKYGIIIAPMICLDNKVVCRMLPNSIAEFNVYISEIDNKICPSDSILLY